MAKNIVICLDGTWNGPDAKADDGSGFTPSNVQKLFEALAGSAPLSPTQDECEIEVAASATSGAQVAKYIHGVGDATRNALARAVQGAVGLGLVGRVVRGYTYLSRNYTAGDRIYIVGFSRGAYAARALAGLVVSQGLLDWAAMNLTEGSEESYSAGLAAWQRCKAAMHAGDPSVLQGIADVVTRLRDDVHLRMHPAPPLRFVSPVPIEAVGVWDTVGALGVPVVTVQASGVERADVFEFANTRLAASVKHGFHAIAADEQRVDFTPSIWEDRDGVVQVIFPGAHADVGGGYPANESGLSNGALAWMVRQLAGVGVLFSGPLPHVADAFAIQHTPWSPSKVVYVLSPRRFRSGLRLSQSLLQRLAAPAPGVRVGVQPAATPYRPSNLVDGYLTLDPMGAVPHVQIEP
jgi:uncharacterized protein (DUF2235 family)